MKISVVILNWNGASMLRKYLPSVIRCSEGSDAEIVVADNASTDDSLSVLQDFKTVRTIVLDRNYGFAEGYNLALKQIDSEYFLLLNSDVEIRQTGWLRPLLDYMDSHPDCAACQPKLMALREPGMFEYAGAAGGFLDRYGYPFCRGRILSTVEKDEGQYDTTADLLWATGAALMVRRLDYWNAGGLDGRFFAHMEEIDLCWRLRSMGRRIVCVPESKAYHLGGATLNQGNPRKTYLNYRNNLLMLYKNLPEKDLRHVMSVRTFLDWLSALPFLLKLDFANFNAVLRARRDFKKMRRDFAADRKTNMQKRVAENIHEHVGFSILWHYFFKGEKKFSDLPF